MVWNQTINSYITERCSMKFPENELIYIVQSNIQWKIPQNVGPKEFCLFSSFSLTSKANKIQMYSKLKTCQWPCTLTTIGVPWQVQHFNVEKWSTIAISTLWCWIIILFWRRSENILKDYLSFLWKKYLNYVNICENNTISVEAAKVIQKISRPSKQSSQWSWS